MNIKKVTHGIYRGARPSVEDIVSLKKELNLQSILDLDNDREHVSQEKFNCHILDISYMQFPLNEFRSPSTQTLIAVVDIIKFLRKPVFIH